jgi:hypothetical protein
MENVLNRRMFQQPIYAQSGVYVPTIEQIMNFYGGGFTADGEPKDMEAFQIAIQNANKANEAGLFEDGKPIDTWENLLPRPSTKDFMTEHGVDTMYDPVFGSYSTPGGNVKPSEKHEEFLKNYFLEKEKETSEQEANMRSVQAAQEEEYLKASGVGANEAIKNAKEIEQQQSGANQKELFELLQEAKVKNLAGETEREVSEDENVEMIKRNILQGTNIVEPGTEEFRELSATDRMKVSDAISAQKRAEVDLSDVSEKGIQNIIDAAGESTETALIIWNDMKNIGGEVAEAANEMLQGWKKAISSGWSDERKKELNDQIDYLKSKSPKDGEQSLFGVTMEDLEEGSTKVKDWYDDTIFPEAIEGGADIIQNIFGTKEAANAELLSEDEVTKAIEDQELAALEKGIEGSMIGSPPALAIEKAEQGDSVDTSIFKEETEDEETMFGKIVTDLNEQMDKLFSDRENNLIDGDTFNEAINTINDKKNDLLEKFNETDTKKWLDKKGEELSDFRKQALEDGADINEDGKVGPIELFEYHLKQKKEKQEAEDRIKGSMIGSPPALAIEQAEEDAKKRAEKIVEESKVTVTEGDGVATIEDTEQEIVTTDEVADGDAAITKADTAAAALASDTVGLGAADEAVPAGTSAMAQLIAETAKETGYNFGALDQTKDDLALKTIMYGLKLAMTPGKFHEAVLGTGFEAVRNEINERYKTKASKQKFAGTLFNTMLAGKLDIEKERVKAANKPVTQKKYDFGKNFERDVLLKISTGNIEKGLGFDLSGLGLDEEITEDNKGAKMFVQDIMNEMQILANRNVTGGDEVDPDILFNQAIENLSPVYSIVTKDLSSVMSWLDKNVWLPGKWDAPRETTITRKRTDTKPELTSKTAATKGNLEGYTITEEIVTQTMKKYNKTREEVLAEYAKLGADISGV